jgi:hypothetical protein
MPNVGQGQRKINKRLAVAILLMLAAFLFLIPKALPFAILSKGQSPQDSMTASPNSTPTPQSSPKKPDGESTLDNLEKVSNIIQSIFTIIALIVGAIWTYFTFVKGRALTPRLEPKLSLKTFTTGNQKYLVATIQLKNAGSTKVDIVQEGTILGVFSYEPIPTTAEVESIEWSKYKASPILKDHYWIEPGETLEEPVLFTLPVTNLAIYKVLLRINSKKTTWTIEAITEGKV